MKVQVIASTPNPHHVAAFAARTCYGSKLTDWYTEEGRREFNQWYEIAGRNLLRNCIKSGHTSIFEHISFTFFVSEISRVLSHQWVRHRIGCSPSQRSQRYCKEKDFDYVTPPSFCPELAEKFDRLMDAIGEFYDDAVNNYGAKPEDARYALPNACFTELTFSFNVTSFRHFLSLRLDKHAQWEIRGMAKAMLLELVKREPDFEIFFEDFLAEVS